MIKHAWSWDMLPHSLDLNQTPMDLSHRISQTRWTENLMLVGGSLQKSLRQHDINQSSGAE